MNKFQPRFFNEADETTLKFARPCKHGHKGPDDQGVRQIRKDGTTTCLACRYNLPPGPFTHQFNKDIVEAAPIFLTKEESRQRHIQQVMDYHRRNPDKLKKWQQTWYDNTSEKRKAEKEAKPPKVLTEEQIIAKRERQNIWSRNYYAEHKDEINKRTRQRYHQIKTTKNPYKTKYDIERDIQTRGAEAIAAEIVKRIFGDE